MKLRVLGASGAEVPGYGLSSFLLDGTVLFDAGSVTQALTLSEQKRIKDIFITHSHLDHIRDIAFLADNLVLDNHNTTINIYGLDETIAAIKSHILNNTIWPDFSRIPSKDNPLLRFIPVTPLKEVIVKDYRVLPLPANHTVPAVGYLVGSREGTFVYTGDTGPSEALWDALKGRTLDVMIIEVSFPDEMREMAEKTGHLCPSLLKEGIDSSGILCNKLLISHIKPQYEDKILTQLQGIKGYSIEVLDSPRVIEI
ncbi:MAG: 3',5'-cyclic-nucleotide phosphodiesterase, partial [Nitrospirae bacterium]